MQSGRKRERKKGREVEAVRERQRWILISLLFSSSYFFYLFNFFLPLESICTLPTLMKAFFVLK